MNAQAEFSEEERAIRSADIGMVQQMKGYSTEQGSFLQRKHEYMRAERVPVRLAST